MKRILWNITFSSIITLIAYIALYAVWGAVLSGVENPTLKLFVIALMTTVAFGYILLHTSKIRKGVGEDEIVSDYEGKQYVSFADDFKLVLKRESKILICIAVIVFICFALNTFDDLVFKKKTISLITFFFAPMCLFSTVFDVSFVGYTAGYVLSAVANCVAYIFFLLMYRKKQYDYWMKNKM
ncbi:MAG: hypothetical protein E7665_04295 [Ruminococcaceae bacterium]|nr:hypothetical protein [Oscillospiraceae bacterium]